MSICWYCHWGWPKPVALICKEALRRLSGDVAPLIHGPAHIVWADENFDRAEDCLENFDKYSDLMSDDEKAIVRWSLEQLVAIPQADRDCVPADYDGANPQRFPPQVDVVTKKERLQWQDEFRPKTVHDRMGALAEGID